MGMLSKVLGVDQGVVDKSTATPVHWSATRWNTMGAHLSPKDMRLNLYITCPH
jgi:hypothetical protein